VGPDVLAAARETLGPGAERFFHRRTPEMWVSQGLDPAYGLRDGKMYFDLWQANRAQLLEAGLSEENIHVAGVCTMTRNDLFPSYRLEGASAGRFAAVIAKT
jgi:copper oxidase (laccase) domain-containing protein